MLIKFRPRCTDFESSMARMEMLEPKDLAIYIWKVFLQNLNDTYDDANLIVSPYSGPEARSGWTNVWVVMYKGYGVIGFIEMPHGAIEVPLISLGA